MPANENAPDFGRIVDEIRQPPVAARHAHNIAVLVANLLKRGERFRIDTQVDLTRRARRFANC